LVLYIVHFNNKKREYLKDKINELARHSKFMTVKNLYRGINEFMKGYQSRQCYKPEGCGFDSRWVGFFSVYLILPATL
jgi:hypothetical protein